MKIDPRTGRRVEEMDPGTERALRDLTYNLGPKWERTVKELAKELKRFNDREEAKEKKDAGSA